MELRGTQGRTAKACRDDRRAAGVELIDEPDNEALDLCRGIVIVCDMAERHVKLFRNGRNQAVRIPREFELPGEDAIIRKDGPRLILEPAPPQSLLGILAALPTLR